MNIDGSDPKSVFYHFLYNSKISYVGAGSSGLGLLSLNKSNDSYKILTTNNENVVCSKLFIKIVPIYTNPVKQPSFSLLLPDMYNASYIQASIYSNHENDFCKEVYMQNKIYKKTNDNLEPVCPPIVYSEALDNNKSIDLLNKLSSLVDKSHYTEDEDDTMDPLNDLSNRYQQNKTLRLGIIGMGFTEGYVSLFSMFHNNYPNITHYLNLALYELIRLYLIGYMHGDMSLANIMINTNYNYNGTRSGRAMLIDFGMTFTHKYTEEDIKTILIRMLTTETEFSGLTPMEHANYKWFVNYTNNSNNLPSIIQEINNLRESISAHSTQMIDMISTTYPKVLNKIRMYNATETDNTNIFYGGLKNTIQSEDVIPYTMNTSLVGKLVPQSKTISKIEFNSIFNPNNLDIPQLLDAYLRTLYMGQQTIQEGIKSIIDKTGGKKGRKRKYSRISSKHRKLTFTKKQRINRKIKTSRKSKSRRAQRR